MTIGHIVIAISVISTVCLHYCCYCYCLSFLSSLIDVMVIVSFIVVMCIHIYIYIHMYVYIYIYIYTHEARGLICSRLLALGRHAAPLRPVEDLRRIINIMCIYIYIYTYVLCVYVAVRGCPTSHAGVRPRAAKRLGISIISTTNNNIAV